MFFIKKFFIIVSFLIVSIAGLFIYKNQVEKTLIKSEQFKNNIKILNINSQLQEEWYYCSPTTISMLLDFKNINLSQKDLADEMGTYIPFGTHNKDAIRILNKYLFGYENPNNNQAGYFLEKITKNNRDAQLALFKKRIKDNIDKNYPLTYTFIVDNIYPGSKGEHMVIGNGYAMNKENTEVEFIYYIDPSPRQQSLDLEGLKVIRAEKLFDAISIAEEPEYGYFKD